MFYSDVMIHPLEQNVGFAYRDITGFLPFSKSDHVASGVFPQRMSKEIPTAINGANCSRTPFLQAPKEFWCAGGKAALFLIEDRLQREP